MQDNEGFSLSTVRSAGLKMKLGIKSDCSISDKFSREDIAGAWREASRRVGAFIAPDCEIHKRLVKNEYDITGEAAFILYDKRMREFIRRRRSENLDLDIHSLIKEFREEQNDITLELFRHEADRLVKDFLSSLYSNVM